MLTPTPPQFHPIILLLQVPVERFPRSLCGFFRFHTELVMMYGDLALPRLWFSLMYNSFLLPHDINFLCISVVMDLQDIVTHYLLVALDLIK